MNTQGEAHRPDGARLPWCSKGDKDPVVLVAGQAVSKDSWDPIVDHLASRFRVITFDQRGVGSSTEGSDPPRTTRAFAEDLAAVLDSADAHAAHVIGHSMGGRVAQWFAIAHPERVGALILIATSGGDSWHPRSAAATADLASGDSRRLAPRFFTESQLQQRPDAADVFLRREGSIRARRRSYDASSTHDSWARLAEIAAPTLVIHGADDAITPPENGRHLAELIPHSEYVAVSSERHAPHLYNAEALERLTLFMAEHPLWRTSSE